MIKKSRIPVIPLGIENINKAIKNEILVDKDNRCLKYVAENGDVIDLNGECDSIFKTGRINMIKGTAFNDDVIPSNFKNDGLVILSQENKLLNMNYLNTSSRVVIELSSSIIKNKKYTISFRAKSSVDCTLNIMLDSFINTNIELTTREEYYSYTFDTSILSTDKIDRIYLTVNTKCNVSIGKLLLEEGTEANEWIETATYNLTISRLIASNIDVLDVLTIKGKPLTEVLQGVGNNLIATGDEIVTSDDLIEYQTLDANYDTIAVQLDNGLNEVICNKTFEDLLYGSYYVVIRAKISSNECDTTPVLNILTSEYVEDTDTLTLLSSTDIYETDFSTTGEFEEMGFITQFKGTNGRGRKNLNITISMIGNSNNPKINIDYIAIGLAAPGLVPLFTTYR